MSSTCTYVRDGIPCEALATHYLVRHVFEETWTLETETRQATKLDGTPITLLVDGKVFRTIPAPEFCLAHAAQVQAQRMAHLPTQDGREGA